MVGSERASWARGKEAAFVSALKLTVLFPLSPQKRLRGSRGRPWQQEWEEAAAGGEPCGTGWPHLRGDLTPLGISSWVKPT